MYQATETCNVVMERKFCHLLEYVLFEYLCSLFLSTDPSKLDLVDFDKQAIPREW